MNQFRLLSLLSDDKIRKYMPVPEMKDLRFGKRSQEGDQR